MLLYFRHPQQSKTDDDFLSELRLHPAHVWVFPHLYYITQDSESGQALQNIQQPFSVISSLYPRAAQTVLMQNFRKKPVHTLQHGNHIISDLLVYAGEGEMREFLDAVTPRWYPAIDKNVCTKCKQCVEYCLFGVYRWEDEVKVISPDSCKSGCPACARLCPSRAILFPECTEAAWLAGGEDQIQTSAEQNPQIDDLDELIRKLDELEKQE